MLLGNLGKDPEMKMLADGTPVARMTLATTETYRLKDRSSKTHHTGIRLYFGVFLRPCQLTI